MIGKTQVSSCTRHTCTAAAWIDGTQDVLVWSKVSDTGVRHWYRVTEETVAQGLPRDENYVVLTKSSLGQASYTLWELTSPADIPFSARIVGNAFEESESEQHTDKVGVYHYLFPLQTDQVELVQHAALGNDVVSLGGDIAVRLEQLVLWYLWRIKEEAEQRHFYNSPLAGDVSESEWKALLKNTWTIVRSSSYLRAGFQRDMCTLALSEHVPLQVDMNLYWRSHQKFILMFLTKVRKEAMVHYPKLELEKHVSALFFSIKCAISFPNPVTSSCTRGTDERLCGTNQSQGGHTPNATRCEYQ